MKPCFKHLLSLQNLLKLNHALICVCMLGVLLHMTSAQAAQNQYTVLAYHNVVEEKVDPKVDDKYLPQTIRVETIIAHFNWLKINGYTVISFQDVLDARAGGKPLPEKSILLTFDDGYESFYRLVFPLLKLYHYPAVLAVMGKWIDTPENEMVGYGSEKGLQRDFFLTWSQIKQLHDSGLVEIASHSYDLHHAELSSSEKSQQPAAVTPIWKDGQFETLAQYQARVSADLTKSSEDIKRHIGIAPRIMVWPYGRFSDLTSKMASQAGMVDQFTLQDEGLNSSADHQIKRLLMEEETDFSVIKSFLKGEIWQSNVQRVVHVDLDYVYDKDPKQQAKNIDALLERIKQYGISTVYLQAYADANGDGVAEALYFHNRHMPVRADLFSRVAWQLMTRVGVKVYAWMPVMAFDLGAGHTYVTDVRTGSINPKNYKRLSPYDANNRKIITEIYEDLGLYTKFNGILFHDDAFLDDFEGIDAKHAPAHDGTNAAQVRQQAIEKTKFLIDWTQSLKASAAYYQMGGARSIKTARNMYASVITDHNAQDWFAQNLEMFSQAYDYTAVMAMPYMEGAQQPDAWLAELARNVSTRVDPSKVVFELQATDWNSKKPIPSSQLANWMHILQNNGIRNYGYYPDDFLNNTPDAKVLHPAFSIATQGKISP